MDFYSSVRQDIGLLFSGKLNRFRENALYPNISRKKPAFYLIALQGDPIFRKSHSHIEFPSSWMAQNHHRLYISQLLTEVDSEDGLSQHPFQPPCDVWVQFKTPLPFPILLLQWGLQMRHSFSQSDVLMPDFDSEVSHSEKRQRMWHLFCWPGSWQRCYGSESRGYII